MWRVRANHAHGACIRLRRCNPYHWHSSSAHAAQPATRSPHTTRTSTPSIISHLLPKPNQTKVEPSSFVASPSNSPEMG
eukprot:538834-Prorocentrum_minimum.AAC.3